MPVATEGGALAMQTLLTELFAAPPAAAAALGALTAAEQDGHTGIVIDDAARRPLIACGLAGDGTAGDPATALVVDGDWLCSRRTWRHERDLACALVTRARQTMSADDLPTPADLDEAFPDTAAARAVGGIDWQRRAAETALAHGLTLITGGPGCGKTTVAGRIAALLARVHRRAGRPPPVVVLAAPTGKAAARLAESVRQAATGLAAADAAVITGWASTLHRLFHHPRTATVDLAIIDETSMASAATLGRVLARLPDRARVLLLGDPDQLASVEPGRVLGDCAAVADDHPLRAVSVRLRVNWRSGEAPALAALVAALQAGATDAADLLPDAPPTDDRSWVQRCDPPRTPASLIDALINAHQDWLEELHSASDPAQALRLVDGLRLLTVLRQGPWGAEALNARWEERLRRQRGLIADGHGHYPGRLLLVTRNRPDLDLANGDIGICWPDAEGRLSAHFPALAGTRAVPVHRLDQTAPAWFLTVHKAQGSQGTQVEVIGLPTDATPGQRLLATREMAYTAITRAARRLRVWWDADGLAQALARRDLDRRRSNFPHQLARAAQTP